MDRQQPSRGVYNYPDFVALCQSTKGKTTKITGSAMKQLRKRLLKLKVPERDVPQSLHVFFATHRGFINEKLVCAAPLEPLENRQVELFAHAPSVAAHDGNAIDYDQSVAGDDQDHADDIMVDGAGQTQGAVANIPMAAASVADRGGAPGNNPVAAPVSNRREAAGHGQIQPAIGRRQGAVGQTQAGAAAARRQDNPNITTTDQGQYATNHDRVAAPASNRREAAGHGRIQPAIGRRQGGVGQTQAGAAAVSHRQDAVQIGATNGRSSVSPARVATSASRSTYSRTDEVGTGSSSSERTDEEMGMSDDADQSDEDHAENVVIELSDGEYEGHVGDPYYDSDSGRLVVDVDWVSTTIPLAWVQEDYRQNGENRRRAERAARRGN